MTHKLDELVELLIRQRNEAAARSINRSYPRNQGCVAKGDAFK